MKRFILLLIYVLLSISCSSGQSKALNQKVKLNLEYLLTKNDSVFKVDSDQLIANYASEISNICSSLNYNNSFFTSKSMYDELLSNKIIMLLQERKGYGSNKDNLDVELNIFGDYFNFLKYYSSKYKFIDDYCNSLKSSGGISPISTKILCTALTKENLKDKNLRIIASVHFFVTNWKKN